MYQFDDRFLESVGLSELGADQKETFLDYAQEQFETKVGEVMSANMSEAQLEEFDKIADGDPGIIESWLAKYPDYAKDGDYRRIANNIGDGEEAKVNFVTKKWLDANCPNYDQLMANTLAAFQKEIYENRASILEQ